MFIRVLSIGVVLTAVLPLGACQAVLEDCRCKGPVHGGQPRNTTRESKSALTFHEFYPGFEYPSEELRAARLAEYLQQVDGRLLSQTVDATLREMSYLAMGANIVASLEEMQADETLSRMTRLNAGVLLKRWRVLEALDYASSPAFVRKALAEVDVDALCVAMPANWHDAIYVIEGLRRLNDTRAVPSLAYYLGSLIGTAGSNQQSELINKRQKEALYSTLFMITGVAPAHFHDTGADAVRAYLLRMDHWVTENIVVPAASP